MTHNKKIRAEIIYALKTSALQSDQNIADKVGASRATVWNCRKKINEDIIAYLGKDFINFRVSEMFALLQRLKNSYDTLEDLKHSTNAKIIQNKILDPYAKIQIPYFDVKHIPIPARDKITINFRQLQVEKMIYKVLSSGLLKAANAEHIVDNPLEK